MHRANGGFIILQAADLLSQSRSWDAVKRMLRFGNIWSESISESTGIAAERLSTTAAYTGQVKVVLIGDVETTRFAHESRCRVSPALQGASGF